MTNIIEAIKAVVQSEISKIHIMELGTVTSVFPHSSESDKDNYECNIKLRDKDVELRKVPVATQHIGLTNMLHVNDLVVISFINGDVNSPVVVGRLYNDEDRPPSNKMEEIVYKPPYTKDDNLRRINIVLPQEVVTLTIHDNRIGLVVGKSTVNINSQGEIQISSSENSKTTELSMDTSNFNASARGTGSSVIKMDESGNVTITASKTNCVFSLTESGIILKSDSDIQISTPKTLKLAANSISLQGKGGSINIDPMIPSQVLSIHGKSLGIESDTTAEIKSTALMNIKGGIVNIN